MAQRIQVSLVCRNLTFLGTGRPNHDSSCPLGLLGNATVQQNTPGTSFGAFLPTTEFDPLTGTTITGLITGTVPANGTGVIIDIDFTGFPAEAAYGPFGESAAKFELRTLRTDIGFSSLSHPRLGCTS